AKTQKNCATTVFFAPKLSKFARLLKISRQTSTNPPHINIFRPKLQQFHASPMFFAPNLNKSAPQQKFSLQQFFSRRTSISKPLSSLQLSLLKTVSPSLIVSTTCISLISIVSTSNGFRSNTTKSASFPSAILPFSSSSK